MVRSGYQGNRIPIVNMDMGVEIHHYLREFTYNSGSGPGLPRARTMAYQCNENRLTLNGTNV